MAKSAHLHAEEIALSKYHTKGADYNIPNRYPSKEEYENALKTIKKYEKRQQELQSLKDHLSYLLQKFESVNFKVDKKKGEVLFSGYLKDKNKVVMGKSICSDSYVFEVVIGKVIAVKKALNENIDDIVKLVEKKYLIHNFTPHRHFLNEIKWI